MANNHTTAALGWGGALLLSFLSATKKDDGALFGSCVPFLL